MRLACLIVLLISFYVYGGQVPYKQSVVHLDQFYPYAFEGNVQVKSRIIFEKLKVAQIGKKDLDSAGPLIADVVKKAYAALGFRNVKISLQSRGHLKVILIEEGFRGIIDRVILAGLPEDLKRLCLKRSKARLSKARRQSLFNPTAFRGVVGILNPQGHPKISVLHNTSSRPTDGEQVNFLYTPENSEVFGEELQAVLDGAGYLNAKVFGPRILWDKNQKFGTMQFRIRPGKAASVNKILWTKEAIENKNILKKLDGMSGNLLNKHAISQVRDQIEEVLLNTGYVKPSVSIYLNSHQESHNVDVEIEVARGPRTRIDAVDARGTERTSKTVFEEEVLIRPGEYFSWDKFQTSRFNLLKLDIFDHVSLEIYGSNSGALGSKNILVANVREKPRYLLDLGAGISLEDGPRLLAKFRVRNIWGLGGHLDTNLQLNYPAVFYGLSFVYAPSAQKALIERFSQESDFKKMVLFTEGKLILALDFPKIYPWTARLGANIYGVIRREIRVAYTLNQVLIRLSASGNFGKNVSLGPKIEGSYSQFDCALPGYFPGGRCGETGVVARHRLDAGLVEQIALGVFLEKQSPALKNTMDANLTGRLDFYFGIGSGNLYANPALSGKSSGRLLKEIRYFKLHAHTKFSWAVTKYLQSISQLQIGGLINIQKKGYVPLFERFYLGGGTTLRGFPEDQVLPADDPLWPVSLSFPAGRDPDNILSQGGNFLISLQTEMRFPMTDKLFGAVFADAGQLLNKIEKFSLGGFALGIGIGLRYELPIGQLKLDLAMRLIDGKRLIFRSLSEAFGIYFSLEPT